MLETPALQHSPGRYLYLTEANIQLKVFTFPQTQHNFFSESNDLVNIIFSLTIIHLQALKFWETAG